MQEYEDIRYAVPPTAPRPMPRAARAAQFAPFAAVAGHEAALEEAARQAMVCGEADSACRHYGG